MARNTRITCEISQFMKYGEHKFMCVGTVKELALFSTFSVGPILKYWTWNQVHYIILLFGSDFLNQVITVVMIGTRYIYKHINYSETGVMN